MATMTSPALDRAKAAGLTDNHIQRLTGIATDYPKNDYVQHLRLLDQMWGLEKEWLTEREHFFTTVAQESLCEVNRILYGTQNSLVYNLLLAAASISVCFRKDEEQRQADLKEYVSVIVSCPMSGLTDSPEDLEWLTQEAQNCLEMMGLTRILIDARIAEAQRA